MSGSTHLNEFVADTVALVNRVAKRRLGAAAKAIFDSTEAGSAIIYIPAMVLAEIMYLSERNRIPVSVVDVHNYLSHTPSCKEYPMDFAVIQSASQITDIPELHDRLIAGTARLLNLDLITNDRLITASSFVRTVW